MKGRLLLLVLLLLALVVLGFMLMNVVSVFTFFALMGLTTNVVSAITGTSVAFTAILAKLMLKERLGKGRLAWTIALFAAIAAAGFLGEGGSSGAKDLSPLALYAFFGIPFAVGVILFVEPRQNHFGFPWDGAGS